MNEEDIKLLEENEWEVECESPFEIRFADGGAFASGCAADIILWDLVTYGYGERISWADIESQKDALEEWAKAICKKHKCSYEIFISANYW